MPDRNTLDSICKFIHRQTIVKILVETAPGLKCLLDWIDVRPQFCHSRGMKSIALLVTGLAFLIVLTYAAQPAAEVTHIPAEKVAAGFAKGGPLLETADYKIHTARRSAPGEAELHDKDTDIFHIIEGSASFVTGGTIANSRTEAPGEIRGQEIAGGKTQRLKKGDVIVIPAGVPHWFKEVEGPFLYYVVKVTQQGKK